MSDSTEQTYKKLCEDYDEIIKEPIVLDPAKDPTIFDISAYPHYENVKRSFQILKQGLVEIPGRCDRDIYTGRPPRQ